MGEQPDWSNDWRAEWVYLLADGAKEAGEAKIHRAAAVAWGERWGCGTGAVLCGRSGAVGVPGFLGRLHAPRCPRCCDLAGVPPGCGNPHNERKEGAGQ